MKSKTIISTLVIMSVVPIIIVSSMTLLAYRPHAKGAQVGAYKGGEGERVSLVWETQAQYYDQNSSGTFGINGVLVSSSELYLFYALAPTTNLNGVPQVTATSCAPLITCHPVIVNSVQSLGSLQSISNPNNRYPLGLIRLAWGDMAGQAISVSATFPGVSAWTVTPLRQKMSATNFGSSSNLFLNFPKYKPDEVKSELGVLGSVLYIGALQQFLAAEPLANPVYVAVDNQGAVQVITGAEYALITNSLPVPPDPPDPSLPPTPTSLSREP